MMYFFANLLSKIELVGKIININASICEKLIENLHKLVIFLRTPFYAVHCSQKYKLNVKWYN